MFRELRIGFVAYAPLGRGLLTGTIRSTDGFADHDIRKSNPRFSEQNLAHNLTSADLLRRIADDLNATPAQVALAWLLARGPDIVPIPGTKHVSRLAENLGADTVELAPQDLARLDELLPAAGDHITAEQAQWLNG